MESRSSTISVNVKKFIRCSVVVIVCAAYIAFSCIQQHTDFSEEPGQRTTSLAGRSDETSLRVNVLLVTYYRGGSSFLGEIFNQNPSVFYMFEPYIAIYQNTTPRGDSSDLFWDRNGNRRYSPREYFEEAKSLTNKIFNCSLDSLDDLTMAHKFFSASHKSTSLLQYQLCVAQKKKLATGKWLNRRCARHYASSECRSADHRVVKTIRTPMDYAEQYMESDPLLKVVYYVRDPRGILNSCFHIQSNTAKRCDAKRLCGQIGHDWTLAQQLQKNGRVKIARYEDLAMNPMETAQQIYDFVGLEMPLRVIRWVKRNTDGDIVTKGTYGTSRNAEEVVDHWKTSLSVGYKHNVTKVCRDTLDLLGYPLDV